MSFKVKLPMMEFGAVYDHSFFLWSKDTNGDRVAADLTGYGAEMEIYKGGVKVASLSTEDGTIVLSGNRIRLLVMASVTKSYASFTEADYDLLLLPGKNPELAQRCMYGKIPGERVLTQL